MPADDHAADGAFLPYLPIEQHGPIGDRRTAALVAADGTLSWLCLPCYDSPPVFGALLDAARGGWWRIGPAEPRPGQQRYIDETAALCTTWQTAAGTIELTDVLAWPQDDRPPGSEQRHVVIRRLRCLAATAPDGVACTMGIVPRDNFDSAASTERTPHGLSFTLGQPAPRLALGLWTSFPLSVATDRASAELRLQPGETHWAVLACDESPDEWTAARAQYSFDQALRYWHDWQHTLIYTGPRDRQVRRSALLVHLLSYAPSGSLVAAPTTSLPERIGGERNYDYRYAWVRDASMSLAVVSLLGDTRAGERYMDWLMQRSAPGDAPLQVAYRVDGNPDLHEHRRYDLDGYRSSRPIRIGNRAFRQRQLDSLGFLAECALVYLDHGGPWRDDYWQMMRRAADYTVAHWQLPDSGIWELPQQAHYVSSKVMSWVTLKRAVQIATRLGRLGETDSWRATMDAIMAEVMQRGWSEPLGAFRQRYDADSLDASTLLIPVMGFLPADHPRVLASVAQIEARLTIDGFVHRFEPRDTPGHPDMPVGAFEGAFLPCTFWLATTYAKQGRTAEAETLLERAEAIAGPLGLFAEQVDVRSRSFRGNSPLLWSQVEYVQAIIELAKARPLDHARYLAGAARIQLQRRLSTPRTPDQPDA